MGLTRTIYVWSKKKKKVEPFREWKILHEL